MFGAGACGPGGRGRFMGPPPHMRHLFEFGGEHGGKWGGGAVLHGLDLSDDQVERIAELKQKTFSKLAHGKIDLVELHKQLFKELGSATIDRNAVNAVKEKIKEHKAQLTDLMVSNMIAFAEVLTPEQRKKARINKIRHFLGLGESEGEED
jgi:Spy/CpxP family protein refolding chaperone